VLCSRSRARSCSIDLGFSSVLLFMKLSWIFGRLAGWFGKWTFRSLQGIRYIRRLVWPAQPHRDPKERDQSVYTRPSKCGINSVPWTLGPWFGTAVESPDSRLAGGQQDSIGHDLPVEDSSPAPSPVRGAGPRGSPVDRGRCEAAGGRGQPNKPLRAKQRVMTTIKWFWSPSLLRRVRWSRSSQKDPGREAGSIRRSY
jgi:hypothetical protein